MDTAIFWMEYVARNKGTVNMKTPPVDVPLHQYLMIDVIFVLGSITILMTFIAVKMFTFLLRKLKFNSNVGKQSIKKRK